jgi:hypothetical protein
VELGYLMKLLQMKRLYTVKWDEKMNMNLEYARIWKGQVTSLSTYYLGIRLERLRTTINP